MNYPESALLTGLVSAIAAKLPTRNIYTIPPKDLTYPYIQIDQTFMEEIGSKVNYIYRFEPLIQVIHKDISKLADLLSDMQKIHELITNGTGSITVSGYTVLAVELISTNRTSELYDWGRLDIGLIRMRIDIE